MQTKFILGVALAASISFNASADQQAVSAIQATGVALTAEQVQALESAQCSGADCSAVEAVIADIIAQNASDSVAVKAIVDAIASAPALKSVDVAKALVVAKNKVAETNPQQAQAMVDNVIESNPDLSLAVAQATVDIASQEATAAAPVVNQAENGEVAPAPALDNLPAETALNNLPAPAAAPAPVAPAIPVAGGGGGVASPA